MSTHLSTTHRPALQRLLRMRNFDFVRAYPKLITLLCVFIALSSTVLAPDQKRIATRVPTALEIPAPYLQSVPTRADLVRAVTGGAGR